MEDQGTATTRRRFLGTAAGATGVALGAAVWGANQAAAAAIPGEATQKLQADKRGFVAGQFAIELDGQPAGFLRDSDGGLPFADVVLEKVQPGSLSAKKHIGGVKYEDFTVAFGFGLEKIYYDWISAAWTQNFQRKNGAIVAADFNFQARSRREFTDALITEIGFPACDASSKDPAYMTLKFAPESTRTTKASGKLTAPTNATQKAWLPSNFRLEIDGLDCTRVSKIEALTIKQSVIDNAVGENRDFQREPGAIEFPNLIVTLSQSTAGTWQQWFEDFVIKGIASDSDEKSGSLTFLSSNLQTELGRINFFNIGIYKLDDDPAEDVTTGATILRVRAEMYVERMQFTYLGNGAKTQPSPTPTPAP